MEKVFVRFLLLPFYRASEMPENREINESTCEAVYIYPYIDSWILPLSVSFRFRFFFSSIFLRVQSSSIFASATPAQERSKHSRFYFNIYSRSTAALFVSSLHPFFSLPPSFALFRSLDRVVFTKLRSFYWSKVGFNWVDIDRSNEKSCWCARTAFFREYARVRILQQSNETSHSLEIISPLQPSFA